MKSIQNAAASIFILAVAVLSAVSIFGVWDFFSKDVITKSFQTLGLLALVAVIVMVAGRFMESRAQSSTSGVVDLPSPAFKTIRQITLTVLIVAVSLLALLGVLAIWDVISDKQILHKALSSLGILAFGAFIMVMTCLERENKLQKSDGRISGGFVILIIVLIYLLFSFSSRFSF